MKKKNGLLLISALGALILSGCSLPGVEFPDLSEITTQHSIADNSKNPSSNGSSSNSGVLSSSQSTSSSALPSEIANKTFDELGLTGTYQVDTTKLVIESDKTLSFSVFHSVGPAVLLGFENGVYHITATADSQFFKEIDIHIDGTLAYVATKENNGEYIMRKNAGSETRNAAVMTIDGSLWIGGIQYPLDGDWKYLARYNGAYYNGVVITVIECDYFYEQNAIFDIEVAGIKKTYKVTGRNSGVYYSTITEQPQ